VTEKYEEKRHRVCINKLYTNRTNKISFSKELQIRKKEHPSTLKSQKHQIVKQRHSQTLHDSNHHWIA
jgi:hypothetical protein